ncbi:MAG: hypothetical protein HKP27_07415 [Myxococcales bacterium]|nr:hypothetical protein [Myxococcales bacterium]
MTTAAPPTIPPLRPFGLILHHDGRWTHEGQPIRNRKLREAFDRGVRYLPDEDVFVVTLGRFRGQIEVEEAAFFVRSIDLATGRLMLSDGSEETLDPSTLVVSSRDGALLCRIPRAESATNVLARFDPGPHAELLLTAEADDSGISVACGGLRYSLPDAVVGELSD